MPEIPQRKTGPTSKKEDPLIEQGRSKVPIFIKSGWSFLLEVGKVVVISLAIITIVKNFLFQPFYVKGASMEPTFFDREYLIINEISYRFHAPERGDIIVLRYPRDPSQFFIKRIVGLPGEKVDIQNGAIMIYNNEQPDGFALNESIYLDNNIRTTGTGPIQLSADEYFVLGDNRPASLDSRSASLGPVHRSAIIGRAWFRLWPIQRFTVFDTPQYVGSDE